MQLEPIETITSRTMVIDRVNVDTDQIIPARFLTTTERGALADACFADWRFHGDGSKTDHVLNTTDVNTHAILVAGDNFGCGSSREHAPWALRDFGFEAIITSRAADIFKSNALKNGLVVVEVPTDVHQDLLDRPGEHVSIDLERMEVRWGNHCQSFSLDAFARTCLRQGLDPMGYILSHGADIDAFEAAHTT